MITVYHHPACSKCSAVCEILDTASTSFTLIDYLNHPPTRDELTDLLSKLKMKPFELLRKSEPVYQEKFSDKQFNDAEWIDIILQNPVLIERPIVVDGDKAIICRPPEKLKEFLK